MTQPYRDGGFIRTVLGDIPPSALGVCYAHEHIIIDPGYMTEKHPDFLLDSVENAAGELSQFKKDGGSAMIDSMPTGGRNAAKLAEVSRHSGVHIVCPTGLHLKKYYPDGHWGERLSAEELAEVFVREIEDGIGPNDLSGPEVERLPQRAGHSAQEPSPERGIHSASTSTGMSALKRTEVRAPVQNENCWQCAGVIKIASGLDRLNERERKIFEAAALAHRRTGCPILTHTEQGTAAVEQVELLRELGVDLRHVCLSHTDRKPDADYHRGLLKSGVRVEFDSAFRWKPGQGNPTLDLICALVSDFPDQIMLGMDAARRGYWKVYGGGPGLSYLLTTFSAQLRERGLSEDLIHRMFMTTPASTFQFAAQ